ncbi:MAG: TIGR02587 family membrane protein, partial [Acidobacteriota bacterium]|nr:TIGR02587 family membrane protein [Acidobacteriota bacterium]
SVNKSLKEYIRGVAGGLLFSLPLLYTMEVWRMGVVAHPWRLAIYMLATFVLLLGYNFFGGLRRDANFAEVAIDSVEEMGLGLLLAVVALWLLGRITFDMTSGEIAGITIIEAMTVAIGVSVGTAQLGGEDDGDKGEAPNESAGRQDDGERAEEKTTFGGQMVIAACGAALFAANVAPTEEIVLIAAQISVWRILALALLSLALGALILYYSDFMGAHKFVHFDAHHDVLVGMAVTYAVALAVSALILWFFGRFDGQPLIGCLAQTVVLGVAAMMGAAAGRLLLQ